MEIDEVALVAPIDGEIVQWTIDNTPIEDEIRIKAISVWSLVDNNSTKEEIDRINKPKHIEYRALRKLEDYKFEKKNTLKLC